MTSVYRARVQEILGVNNKQFKLILQKKHLKPQNYQAGQRETFNLEEVIEYKKTFAYRQEIFPTYLVYLRSHSVIENKKTLRGIKKYAEEQCLRTIPISVLDLPHLNPRPGFIKAVEAFRKPEVQGLIHHGDTPDLKKLIEIFAAISHLEITPARKIIYQS